MSHETIYRSLFIQARGVLNKELVQHLRSERLMRRSVHARAGGKSHGQIVDAISIRERPAEVEDRAIPGHWEGDLLAGIGNSHIATLVERQSRFTMLVKVPSKDTATVVAALSRQVRKLPASLRRSLTWDRGLEMAKHKSFTVDTKVQVYFCDPQSPWQRGTNENTNGCCDSTSLRRPTYLVTLKPISTKSPYNSINAREKLWALRLPLVDFKPVLHRPSEPAALIVHIPAQYV